MTCKECKHAFKAPDGLHCRRYPPQGQMIIEPAKMIGGAPTKTSVSFYPNINPEMTCGEYASADNDSA